MPKKQLKKLPFEEFKSIYSRVPCLCVEAIVETEEGVVLTRRSVEPDIGKWHVTGVTVLKGEKLEEAVKRAAREELGVKVKIEEMVGAIEYDFPGYFRQPIAIAYRVKPLSTKFRVDENADEWHIFKKIPKNILRGQGELLKKLGYKSLGKEV